MTFTTGTVHFLGAEAAESGAVYAKLTNRCCRPGDAGVFAAGCDDVVVCTTDRLSARLLHDLYAKGPRPESPGLLFAPSPDQLLELCRRRAAESAAPAIKTLKRVFLYSSEDFSEVRRGEDVFIGSTADPNRLLSLIASQPAILAIVGHSDGIDIRLSQWQFGCPFLDEASTPSPLPPYCQIAERCRRFPSWPSIDEARRAGWIVPTDALQAQIGLIFGCNVLKLNDGVTDPANGLATRLLRRSGFRVLITVWRREDFSTDGALLNGLINDLCAGQTVGTAVRAFNMSAVGVRLGIKLCIIGDPCFALPSGQTFRQLPVSEMPALPDRPDPAICAQGRKPEISLLRSAVARAAEQPAYDRKTGHTLTERIDKYSNALQFQNTANKSFDLREMDETLLEFLSHDARLDLFYGPFSHGEFISEEGMCLSCLEPARIFRRNFFRHRAKPRTIIECANCGDSLDTPHDWNIRPDLGRLNEGMVSIDGVKDGAIGLFMLVTSESSSAAPMKGPVHMIQRLPEATASALVFSLPKQLPSFSLICVILIVNRLETGRLTFKLRKLVDGKIISWLLPPAIRSDSSDLTLCRS